MQTTPDTVVNQTARVLTGAAKEVFALLVMAGSPDVLDDALNQASPAKLALYATGLGAAADSASLPPAFEGLRDRFRIVANAAANAQTRRGLGAGFGFVDAGMSLLSAGGASGTSSAGGFLAGLGGIGDALGGLLGGLSTIAGGPLGSLISPIIGAAIGGANDAQTPNVSYQNASQQAQAAAAARALWLQQQGQTVRVGGSAAGNGSGSGSGMGTIGVLALAGAAGLGIYAATRPKRRSRR